MMIKVIVENKFDAIHELDIKKSKSKSGDRVYTLSYSKNSTIWTKQACGKKILTCTDDGNQYKFEFAERFDFGELQYDDAFFMHTMLRYIYRNNKYGKIKFKKNGVK